MEEFPNLAETMLRLAAQPTSLEHVGRIHHSPLNSYQLAAVTARPLLRQLAPAFLAAGHGLHAASATRYLGDLERRLGDVAGARARYQEALKLYESEQSNLGRANTLRSLGVLALSHDRDPGQALQLHSEARQHYRAEQVRQSIAETFTRIAILLHVADQEQPARESATEARQAARASGIPALVEWIEQTLRNFDL